MRFTLVILGAEQQRRTWRYNRCLDMPPVIALLTDFGHQDHYVGALKGSILSACPDATLVDLVHELPDYDVLAGAFALAGSYPFFPPGTVFVAVVDPDVGSSRRGLALEAGGYRFVGPDNGIFTLVLEREQTARVHELTNARLFREQVSSTFHGRDVFGPVAAALVTGTPLEAVGGAVADPVRIVIDPVRAVDGGEWLATVLHVDRFGNLITTLSLRDLEPILAAVDGDHSELLLEVEGTAMPLTRTYADVAEGEACAVLGSSGYVEIAVHRGSAARILGAPRGAPVRVRKASRRQKTA
jgi:S-adenosyl-L-methionine hydrolase (adenosine-forming)